AAGELHGRPSRRQIDHPHVAPEHARPQPGAERLGAGLLGGKALGVGLEPVGAALGPRPLGGGEDARQEALAVALDHLLDAAHVAEIGADADDHPALARPRAMAARMVCTAFARPENTASPIRKWPMLSSTTCGNSAIASAVLKSRPWPPWTSRPRPWASLAPFRIRSNSASARACCPLT